jgi:glycosyltransferase involved in cell wall biosynthesis
MREFEIHRIADAVLVRLSRPRFTFQRSFNQRIVQFMRIGSGELEHGKERARPILPARMGFAETIFSDLSDIHQRLLSVGQLHGRPMLASPAAGRRGGSPGEFWPQVRCDDKACLGGVSQVLISLIVTTREDRVDKLRRFLASVSHGIRKPFEVVLVSQECGELIAPLLQEYQGGCCIKHVASVRCGISRARNIGLRHASGQVLAFPDDDCWYAADTLSGIVERFTSNPGDAFVCTSFVDPVRRLPFGHKRTAKTNVPISLINAFTFPISGNIFINRSLIKGVIDFDERLGVGAEWGSGEETDLILSLLLDGHQGTFVPAITVYHEINYDRPELFPASKVFDYSRGFGAVIAKSIVQRKQYALSWEYMDLLARATIRLILAAVAFRKSSCLVYLSKIRGMLTGLFEGAGYYA